MALSTEERQIILRAKERGMSKQQALAGLAKYRQSLQTEPEQPSFAQDLGGDVKETFTGIGEDFSRRGEQVMAASEDFASGKQGLARSVFQQAGQFLGGAGDIAGRALMGVGKAVLPQKAEDKVTETTQDVVQNTPLGGIMERFQSLQQTDPQKARDIEAVLGLGEVASLGAVGVGARAAREGVEQATRSLFRADKPASSVDEVIEQADQTLKADTPAAAREAAEAEAPARTLKEKWIGIQPDIKNRIAGKHDKLKEYFDVAHARNHSDTAPTPYEYGARQADSAVQEMERLLNETGGQIGATRQKLGTIRANPDQVQTIERAFSEQLDRLNLEIRNGTVRNKSGTVPRVGAASDVRVLNELYQNLRTVKQNPSLTNLIDLRSQFDAKVKFAKSAREASNSVDPLSRQVRKAIADQAAKIVGKTEADRLKQYSEFMEAYGDLRAFTERRAGGEYLLRLVLSGRGGDARQVVDTIRQHTGIDLMDDATMMTLATDLIGNSRQKNLFRQEMTKSGLDAASLLSGNVSGAAGLLSDFVKNRFLDEEQIFLDAARSPQRTSTPDTTPDAPQSRTQGEAFAGAATGAETDEEGNLSFNPIAGLLGAAAGTAVRKAVTPQRAGFIAKRVDQTDKKLMEGFIDSVRLRKPLDKAAQQKTVRMIEAMGLEDMQTRELVQTFEEVLQRSR